MTKNLKLNDRLFIIGGAGFLLVGSTVAGGLYLLGDIAKFKTKRLYGIAAEIDTACIALFDNYVDILNRYIWKEVEDI